jgi:uncharacterized protein with HEPN domain
MEKDIKELLIVSLEKVHKSIEAAIDSIINTAGFDPFKVYTLREQEPYDALTIRFSRAVEVCLKFFRTYETYLYGESSDTIRDRLLKMEKIGLINNVDLWINMRDVRNRVVHDYLPEEINKTYNLITSIYCKELENLKKKVSELELDKK